jgi:hypothetical protein
LNVNTIWDPIAKDKLGHEIAPVLIKSISTVPSNLNQTRDFIPSGNYRISSGITV